MGSGDFKEFKKNARREGTETDITGNYELGSTNETTLEALDDSTASVPYNIVLKQGADVYDAVGTALFYNLRRSNPGAEVRQFTITAKRSEEHTSELQSLMRISYAVFCLKKNKIKHKYR